MMLDIEEILVSAIQLSQMVRPIGLQKKQSLTNDTDNAAVENGKQ
jgi:hypothetical protein